MWIVLMSVGAAWAGKWDGAPSDVSVTQVVPASAEVVHQLLRDHRGWQQVVPAECATDWELTSQTAGLGARARVKWTIGPMKRRLTVVFTKDTAGQILELEHEGKKGWFTQVRYGEAPEGSVQVTLSTPLTPPPWPVTGVFHKKVRSAWEDCYARTLSNVAARVSGG